jgi:Glyoxalase-like domain
LENLSAFGNLDHIIVGVSNLDEGIAHFQNISGCRAAIGGSHPGWGTRNGLLDLGQNSYLELLAPDPKQSGLRWHPEIATLSQPKIVGWAVQQHELDQFAELLYERDVACIGPAAGSRVRQNGSMLRWRTLILRDDLKGHLPFFIDWDVRSPHPSTDAPKGCSLREFGSTGTLPKIPPPRAGMRLQPCKEETQLVGKFVGLNGREFELVSTPVRCAQWGLWKSANL